MSGSATQSLWLRNGKGGSQVSGIDRNRLTGRGTVWELEEEEDKEGEPATERRREHTDLGFDLGEIEEQVACRASALVLAMTDEANLEAESSKALRLSLTTPSTSADHQALEWRLIRPIGMEDLAAFSAKEVKRAAA